MTWLQAVWSALGAMYWAVAVVCLQENLHCVILSQFELRERQKQQQHPGAKKPRTHTDKYLEEFLPPPEPEYVLNYLLPSGVLITNIFIAPLSVSKFDVIWPFDTNAEKMLLIILKWNVFVNII